MLMQRRRPTRRQVAQTKSIPAPVGGLNARDAIAEMPATDAVTMENWMPTPTNLAVRNGSRNHSTGITGWVETLMAYSAQSGTQKLFAAAGSSIFDASVPGAIGAAVVTGKTSARWQHANFGTPGGEFLVAVNGADAMEVFNGTAWQAVTGGSSPISLTGIATSSLISVAPYKSRLIFIEKNSLRFWYLPVLQVGGAALAFDLASQFKLGGYLVAFTSWNIDTPAGPQDYAAFITSQGEVAVYQGYDPSIPGAWELTGLFRVGRPLGRRCMQKFGSDVYIISVDGLFPLSQALLTDRSQQNKAISNKITNLINTDAQLYGQAFGWQLVLHPMGNKLLVNVPQLENGLQYQYVMNTITGAWTKFTGWLATCWEVMGDQLFFGGNGVVVQADIGTDDNGSQIKTDLRPAFSDFGVSGQQKQWTMVRPVFSADNTFGVVAVLNTDFSDRQPLTTLTLPAASGEAVWDVAAWDESLWAQGQQTRLAWESAVGIGFYASLRLQTVSQASVLSLQAIDYVFQLGGVL